MEAPPSELPELVDDAITEILLRVPPQEPAHLVRVSLGCKPWRRVLTDPAFLHRYRRFHGAPPLLGFFNDIRSAAPITPLASFPQLQPPPPSPPPPRRHSTAAPWTAATGASSSNRWTPTDFSSGTRSPVPGPNIPCWSAAVLCAAAGCDHSSCHGGGPFLVVCVGFINGDRHAHVCAYSSQAGVWGASVQLDVGLLDCCCSCGHLELSRPVIVGDGVYVLLELNGQIAILKYDIGRHCLSIFALLPPYLVGNILIMPTEDSLLGFAGIKNSRLYLFSPKLNADAVQQWVMYRAIDLQTVLPITVPINHAKVIGFAEVVNVIFVATDVGTFIIDLESELVNLFNGLFVSALLYYLFRTRLCYEQIVIATGDELMTTAPNNSRLVVVS